jgi:cytidylate kinase
MSIIQSYIQKVFHEVNIIISKDDDYYNLDNWTRGLFIVGLSGSGKSTLGKRISNDNNCEYIELDQLYKDMFVELYGYDNYFKYMTAYGISTDDQHKELKKMFYDVCGKIDRMLKTKDNRFVAEGVFILFINIDDIINKKTDAVIIKNTSVLRSSYRKIKREKIYLKNYLNIFNGELTDRKVVNEFDKKIKYHFK